MLNKQQSIARQIAKWTRDEDLLSNVDDSLNSPARNPQCIEIRIEHGKDKPQKEQEMEICS